MANHGFVCGCGCLINSDALCTHSNCVCFNKKKKLCHKLRLRIDRKLGMRKFIFVFSRSIGTFKSSIMNLSPNKIYPAADSLIQCQGFYKWCMNKIFQDRLLKLVSIVNVDAVFRSINDQFF